MKVRSGILGSHIRACSYKAWDWLVSEVLVCSLPVHCGGCSRVLGFGMLGSAEGSLVQWRKSYPLVQRRRGAQGQEPKGKRETVSKQQRCEQTVVIVCGLLVATCVSMSRLFGVNGGELTRLFTELLLASVSDLDSGLGWSWTPFAWRTIIVTSNSQKCHLDK